MTTELFKGVPLHDPFGNGLPKDIHGRNGNRKTHLKERMWFLNSGGPPEGKVRAARKTLLDMKEKLLAEGLGKSLPEDLIRSFDIGDEGDRADNERTHEVSILLSARDKEKLLAIEEALEKIREGTYGVCEECGDEIGAGQVESNAPGQVYA